MNREDGGLPGRWLRQRREDAGLSQEELANRSGLSVRTVSSLDRGSIRTPHPRTIRLLGETLGLPAEACDELIAAYRASSRGGPVATSPEAAQLAGAAGLVVPRELPGLARHFVGREDELAALGALADQVPGRVPGPVVISAIGGTAGVGKTALALQWAHQMAGRFPDGQLYVNLRGYGPAEPMTTGEALTGFLRALGVPGPDIPAQTEQRAARYRGLLSGRRVLIILDNACGAGQVRPLLPAEPGCVTLVTSRDTLAGLVARDGAQRLDLDLLPMADAVGLLRALIGSRVDAAPGAAAELAARCSRLPLALRVAAEVATVYPARSLADLASELEDQQQRLDLLDAGQDEDTAVRAVFSWSYRHLDASAARAFRLAGLHPGPDLDRYAAAALAGTTVERAGRLLDVLARGYLIQPTRPGRYAMHDLLRGYARELADRHDGEQERRGALTRLFDYYLHSAATAMAVLRPAERTALDAFRLLRAQVAIAPGPIGSPAAALTWLDTERACLLDAVEYMADNGWPGQASRMAYVLLYYLDGGGHYPEAVILHGHGRRAARKIADRAAEAQALIGLGIVAIRQGRYQDATSHYQQALALFRQAGDTSGVARAGCGLGIIHRLQGRYPQAADHLQQALDLYRAQGDSAGAVLPLGNLGIVALRQGRYPQAADHLQQAVDLARQAGNLDRMADMLSELGAVALKQGQLRRAASLHRRARGVFRKTGNRTGEAHAVNGLGEALLGARRPGDARAEFAAALGLASRIGLRNQQARAHRGLSRAWDALGEPGQARRHWQEALAIFTDLGIPVDHVPEHLLTQRPDQNIASEPASEIAWSGADAQR
jgi:tetratricopeptide (TPR) repeat protein/transcriptional regulator with XRE-family HTH domain